MAGGVATGRRGLVLHIQQPPFRCTSTPSKYSSLTAPGELPPAALSWTAWLGRPGGLVVTWAASDGAAWTSLAARFVQLSTTLEGRFGNGKRLSLAVGGCNDGLKDCFVAGRARTSLTWEWSNQQIVVLTRDGGRPGSAPSLRLVYRTGAAR